MPFSKIHSVAFIGLDPTLIEIEVDTVNTERTQLIIVGLPDTAVKESKDRVMTAIKNTGYSLSHTTGTVNLAPGDLKKEGALYDFPIAIGLLSSIGALKPDIYTDYLIVGELGLGGELRPIHGALSTAIFSKKIKKKGILVPKQNVKEATALPDVEVFGFTHLKEAIDFLKNPSSYKPEPCQTSGELFTQGTFDVDFSDIKGQSHVKRAMEIAAAGGHNMILSGPPGSGKTMLAKAFPGIMPELTLEEALEITQIHSVCGFLSDGNIVTQRPFRSPHHTVSYAGLIGGGSIPRPGEVSLAHCGVLFLDELPEFSRSVLEVLRQPLEDRKVTISRANGNFTFPTDFICIAAMNPCPCGYLGHPEKTCKDSPLQVDRYRSKISGPLLDRIDIHIDVPPLRYQDMVSLKMEEKTQKIRERVKLARERQKNRFGHPKTNSQMGSSEIKKHIPREILCHQIIQQAIDLFGFSGRACNRLFKVALTISDLEGAQSIKEEHLLEALAFKQYSIA